VPPQTYKEMLEEKKDLTTHLLNNHSPRTIQIETFKFLKKMFGENVLGVIAVDAIASMPYDKFIVDCGRPEEIQPIHSYFTGRLVKAIKLSRPGCSYEGDSREDINYGSMNIEYQEINNEYDLEMFEIQVRRAISKWVSLKEN